MFFFKFFDTKAAVTFGTSVADIVIESVPITIEKTPEKHAKKVQSAMRRISNQIDWIKVQHKFNLYQKAKLGNTLRWRLTDKGYETAFAREITEWVLMRIE
nr:hypothetical protein [uncultured Rhodoferax sp.]